MNLAFLASHGGSNMQAILDSIKRGDLNATPVVVISNNSGSQALKRATAECIPNFHLSESNQKSPEKLDSAILHILREKRADLVILAGYMRKIGERTLREYDGRIVNIHPALLPQHGGKGMYGIKVHQSVLKSGERESGVTVHLVDEKYDHGPILSQERVPVLEGDTPETLAKRVLAVEHKLYPATIAKIVSGEITLPATVAASRVEE